MAQINLSASTPCIAQKPLERLAFRSTRFTLIVSCHLLPLLLQTQWLASRHSSPSLRSCLGPLLLRVPPPTLASSRWSPTSSAVPISPRRSFGSTGRPSMPPRLCLWPLTSTSPGTSRYETHRVSTQTDHSHVNRSKLEARLFPLQVVLLPPSPTSLSTLTASPCFCTSPPTS